MDPPSTSDSSLADAMANNDHSSAEGQLGTVPQIVLNTVSGASSAAAAFPACDSSLGAVASVLKCTAAVAKMMMNVIHFDVLVLKSGGAFGDTSNCTSADLAAAFPGATIAVGTGSGGNHVDSAFCWVHNTVPSFSRNQSASDMGGGDNNHGPMFSETGGSGATQIHTGVLTALGTALYNNVNYRLSDIDSLVFGANYNSGTIGGMAATKAGFNARLVLEADSYTWPQPSGMGGGGGMDYSSATYKVLATDGTNNSVSSEAIPNHSSGPENGNPYHLGWNDTFTFTNACWESNTNSDTSTLSSDIAASEWTGSIFFKKFGGAIPSQAEMVASIVNSTGHQDQNRTGQDTFFVMYSKQPDWNDSNCQWGSNPTLYTPPQPAATPTYDCVANDGTPTPFVTVDVTVGAVDGTTHTSLITHVNDGGTSGAYYLQPNMDAGGFNGVLSLINASNGHMMVDELFNKRFILVILDTSSQCGAHGVPSTGAGCAAGNIYNISGSWSCGGMGPCTFTYTALSTSPIAHTYSMPIVYQTNQIWPQNGGQGVVGAIPSTGNSGQGDMKAIQVTLNANGSVSGASVVSSGTSPDASHYVIVPQWKCTASGDTWSCNPDGYFLVGHDGAPFEHASAGLACRSG